MLLLLLLVFNISAGFNLGTKYNSFAQFVDFESTMKLKRLTPERLLQKQIKNDFEIAVTKSYGDMEIWKKKSTNEFEFFHASTKNRILYGKKKFLTAEVEEFFQDESLNDFDLIGGFDPSLNLIARKKNTKEIQLFIDFKNNRAVQEETKEKFLKKLASINLDEYNLAILLGYQFIAQNKETKTMSLNPKELPPLGTPLQVDFMVEKCLYIDLMKTSFAEDHRLHESVQLLKLFANCGAELPKESFFQESYDQFSDYTEKLRFLETLVALNSNRKWSNQQDTENCETIETENYGNLQISRNKDTQEVKFVNLKTNLECLQELKTSWRLTGAYYTAQGVVAKFAPMKEKYEFYGSQDAMILYAVNRKTRKCFDLSDEANGLVPKEYRAMYRAPWKYKVLMAIFKVLAWIGTVSFVPLIPIIFLWIKNLIIAKFGNIFEHLDYLERRRKERKVLNLLESVNLNEYDVFIGCEDLVLLVNKTNKKDIRYTCREIDRKSVEVLKLYLGNSKLTQQDYFNMLTLLPNHMRCSLQILTAFKQNGAQIDDKICEESVNPDFENNNHLRCMYERVLMLKLLQDESF